MTWVLRFKTWLNQDKAKIHSINLQITPHLEYSTGHKNIGLLNFSASVYCRLV